MNEMKILISFRQSEKDIYDLICNHSSKSGFIKDILKEHLKKDINKVEIEEDKK